VTKTIRNLIAAMLLIGASHGAMADFQTGNQLLTKCESEIYFEQGACHGYLIATADTWDTAALWQIFINHICMPKSVTGGQLQKVWIKYANEHPERLHLGAAGLVVNAYGQAFPCG
tara:strand:- start:4 stop:351 length:348 start_codon:yes stop_codon:yes gene_type:complete